MQDDLEREPDATWTGPPPQLDQPVVYSIPARPLSPLRPVRLNRRQRRALAAKRRRTARR